MRPSLPNLLSLSASLFAVLAVSATFAGSTVSPSDRYSWGPNIGWIDWRVDGANGANFNENFASGYLYGANIGWINLGDGTPVNGQHYNNIQTSDFGVNIDTSVYMDSYVLSGYAWSANCGWISFNFTDPSYRPRIEKATGILRGYAWGANIGWLPLDSTVGVVRTGIVKVTGATNEWMLYE